MVNVGNTHRRLSFFVMVLCYSRLMYVEFTVSQSMEHFLGCHLRAFEYFGRVVPEKVMVDNLKSAVLRRLTGEAPSAKSTAPRRWRARSKTPATSKPSAVNTSRTCSRAARACCRSRALSHLTRRHDLLELELPEPDLSLYEPDVENSGEAGVDHDNPPSPPSIRSTGRGPRKINRLHAESLPPAVPR